MVNIAHELRKPPTPSDPQIRILHCRTCNRFEEIPDFEGNPEDDVLLEITIGRHTDHVGRLFKMPMKYMMVPSLKTEILKQMTQGSSGLDVVSNDFYSTSATFRDDAMKCYGQHSRPKGMCPDFRSEKKRLIPKTKAERKDAGLASPAESGPKVYLCDFCVVRSFVDNMVNLETGLSN